MLTFISILLTILILLVGYFLKETPKMIRDALKAEREFGNSRQLQVEAYFRQISGQELQKVLSNWSNLYYNMEKTMDEMNEDGSDFTYQDLLQQTLQLGSERTADILTDFQQYIYKHENDLGEKETATGMVYIACIVSSLKYDFSGYKVNPRDVIKLQIKDYDKHTDVYENPMKEIEQKYPWR
ncbi:hypothetical protein [Lactiplantibacillus plantarum]|uniref:hypothetical protein n=1 Tax=Lactiplantibacillus plantarum TaxID=1590 RepID=UPI003F5297C5